MWKPTKKQEKNAMTLESKKIITSSKKDINFLQFAS